MCAQGFSIQLYLLFKFDSLLQLQFQFQFHFWKSFLNPMKNFLGIKRNNCHLVGIIRIILIIISVVFSLGIFVCLCAYGYMTFYRLLICVNFTVNFNWWCPFWLLKLKFSTLCIVASNRFSLFVPVAVWERARVRVRFRESQV